MGLSLMALALPASSGPRLVPQNLQPGFDPAEYRLILEIFHAQFRQNYLNSRPDFRPGINRIPRPQRKSFPPIPEPHGWHMVFQSRETPLFNRWALWIGPDSTGLISIRGTVMKTASWLENFYAALVPAHGSLRLDDSTRFSYRLASLPGAAVQAGWLLALAGLAPSILSQIRDWNSRGVRNFLIAGHSQGAAIACMLRSYLYYLPPTELPEGIRFKTYESAAPKPGNRVYADDFDFITRGGWAFRVVNTDDWVPGSPLSLQTLGDFNPANPFAGIPGSLRKMNFLARIYLGYTFRVLNRSSTRSARKFRKVLGHRVFRQIRRILPGFREPGYSASMDYAAAGDPIILPPYPGYEKDFRFKGHNVFVYHSLQAYYELLIHDYQLPPVIPYKTGP